MENYIEKMDELIALKKVKGHKATKKENEEYASAWKILLEEEGGFSNKAEKYFYDGFLYTGSKPFVDWVLSSDAPFDALNCLFKGECYGKDTSATFRILINLLAQLIISETSEKNIICPVIKRMPQASKNKERKTIGDAHKTFKKYFVDELTPETSFPKLADLEIKPIVIKELSNLFDELIRRLDDSSLTKKDIETLAAIFTWVHPDTNSDNTANTSTALSLVEQKEDEKAVPASQKTEESSPSSSTEPGITKDPYEQAMEMIKEAFNLIAKLRADAKTADKNNTIYVEDLKREVASLKTQVEAAKQREVSYEEQLTDRNHSISSLNLRIRELEQKLAQMAEQLSVKESEISQRTQMIEALSRDRSKQSEEQLHRLASKLKVEYRDFMDAESLEMNNDLGENMREQLKNVFAILNKAGISLE